MVRKNEINFAVVGVGHIGKRHCNMILNNKESKLLSICDNKILIKLLAVDRITKNDIGAKNGGRIVYMYDIKRNEK